MASDRSLPISMFTCALCLMATRASVVLLGFARTQRMLKRASGSFVRRRRDKGDRDGAMVVVRSVIRAAVYVPTRAVCLEQSLVIWFLLRRRGFEAVVRVGVQPLPFTAEFEGKPLDQHEDFVRNYSILATRD